MDKEAMRAALLKHERIEADGRVIRELADRLGQVVQDNRILKGERSGEVLRTRAEHFVIIEEVFNLLTEGVRGMDDAIDKVMEILLARGPCDDPDCPVCHPKGEETKH